MKDGMLKSQTNSSKLRSQLAAYKSLRSRGWSPAIFTKKNYKSEHRRVGDMGPSLAGKKIVKSARAAYLLLCVHT